MALSLLVKTLSLVALLLLYNSQPFPCICEFVEKIECIMTTDSCYNGITHKEIWMNGFCEDFYIKISITIQQRKVSLNNKTDYVELHIVM